jgi:two-component system LytT family response regulator
MIRTLLIDDEINALLTLEMAIKEYVPELEIIGTAKSAMEGLEEIRKKEPELIFLDIQMPHITGIEFLESQGIARDFNVVFVTAYNQYAIKAFKLNAIDYILKPINTHELRGFVERYLVRKSHFLISKKRTNDLRTMFSNKLIVATQNGREFLDCGSIVRLHADGSYSLIIFTDKKPLLVSKNLKELQKVLFGRGFIRIHKSHVVNLNFIKECSFIKNGGFLKLNDDTVIEISRFRKKELIKAINAAKG